MAEHTLPDEWVRRLQQIWEWQRNFRVTGAEYQNTPNGLALTIRGADWSRGPEPLKLQFLKLSSTLAGTSGGRYNGKSYTGGADLSSTGNLAAANFGTESPSEDSIVWNPSEIGTSSQGLVGRYGVCKYVGSNSDGKRVYILLGLAAAGVDLKNNGTTAVAGANVVNIPTTNGTNTVLEFSGTTPTGDLRLVDPGGSGARGKYIGWNGTVWGPLFITARPA